MRKIFLLFVCICLAFSVYAGRKSRNRKNIIVNYVFHCFKCNVDVPDYKASKLPRSKNSRPKCPKCGQEMRAAPVTR